jgi:hypothetical protein
MISRPGKLSLLIALQILIISTSTSCASSTDDLPPSAQDAILSLSGSAYTDEDGDGLLSSNDTGLANAIILLVEDGALIASALTDPDGQYIFANLSPGRYRLEAGPLNESIQTAPGRGFYDITLADIPGYCLDFGFSSSSRLLAAGPVREHPLMRPAPEEVALWRGQYSASASAVISPNTAALLASEPPKSFSLLDRLDYSPSERDQGMCGNCWAWAGTGVMEMDYARQKNQSDRFSVQFLDSSYNGGCGNNAACCGGWLDNLADFYSAKKMAVPWSNANAHYQDGSGSCGGCSAVKANRISTRPNYKIAAISTSKIATQGVSQEQAIANIKGVLLQGKAIWFGFFLPDAASWSDFRQFWGGKPESDVWQPDGACGRTYSYQSGGGHAVLCLGYNDTDPNNRYWIILNSWGSTAGRPAGLFRMNMDMDYNCSYTGLGYAFYWMTLDMTYGSSENSAPKTPAALHGPAQGSVGKLLSYAATSEDADGDQIFFTFDWGDGTVTKTALSASSMSLVNHIWMNKGNYQVKVMATDSNDASSDWSEPLSISISGSGAVNRPPNRPSAPSGIQSGLAGTSYTFATYAADPDRDMLLYTFDWGDGQTTRTDLKAAGQSASASHAWSEAGVYQVSVQASDNNGAQSSSSATKTVAIRESPRQENSRLQERISQEISSRRADLLRRAKGLDEA